MRLILYSLVFVVLLQLVKAECNVSLEIKTNKVLYENETIKYKIYMNEKKKNFTIEYWIEDLFGNIVKPKRNTTNLNIKSFTPKNIGTKPLLIRARILKIPCENIQIGMAQALVVNKGSQKKSGCVNTNKGIAYYLEYAPKTVISNAEFFVILRFDNFDEISHQIKVWSYVYRGSKTYSKNKIDNQMNFTLEPNSFLQVKLKNKVEADAGEYKLKIKILKDNLKTAKQITKDINVTKVMYPSQSLMISSFEIANGKSPKLLAVISNTYKEEINVKLVLDSLYEFWEREIQLLGKEDKSIEFPIEIDHKKNPFFLKLYVNETIVDLKELIVTGKEKSQPPYNLITGDILFNDSKIVYKSASAKSKDLILYALLIMSIMLNLGLLWPIKNFLKNSNL